MYRGAITSFVQSFFVRKLLVWGLLLGIFETFLGNAAEPRWSPLPIHWDFSIACESHPGFIWVRGVSRSPGSSSSLQSNKLNVHSGHGSAERRLPRTLKSKSSYGEGKFYIFKQPKRSKAIDIEERNIKL